MSVKTLSSLEELEEEVGSLRCLIYRNKNHNYQALSKVLFRGQRSENWKLKTTLERYTDEEFTVSHYNTVLKSIYPETASFTGKAWPIDKDFRDEQASYLSTPPNYEFMVYARHHGFPSPLLDWTRSLYIALFFAYQNAKPNTNVIIYAFIEYLSGGKVGVVGRPQINLLGPCVNSHKRHFMQQAQYTISVKHDKTRNWIYCSHEDSLNLSLSNNQDILYKFVLPSNLKVDILAKLNEMNINAFTLYASEESLMKTLAYKEIVCGS